HQSISYIVYLEKGDYIQVYSIMGSEDSQTKPETSRLIISFIPMLGWDNSASGRADYKGGVVR
ncbi:hypothetical protein KKF61_07890, partial [Patescibacteria group bacterium]|nr:hypothetical protein [Patescibacteria group bacterium]